jgi:hypothetical protein
MKTKKFFKLAKSGLINVRRFGNNVNILKLLQVVKAIISIIKDMKSLLSCNLPWKILSFQDI